MRNREIDNDQTARRSAATVSRGCPPSIANCERQRIRHPQPGGARSAKSESVYPLRDPSSGRERGGRLLPGGFVLLGGPQPELE